MKEKMLDQSFYLSSDILQTAMSLLGKTISTYIGGFETTGMITETEAYKAPEDKASHAYDNNLTPRTEVIFREGGCAYVYLCYGMHHMFNVVSGAKDEAHAILIRAVQPLSGIRIMEDRRQMLLTPNLTNGPGKLCSALGINKEYNGTILYDASSKIHILENKNISKSDIIIGPRVGIAYAGECAHWPWRFRIRANPWTSKPTRVEYKKKLKPS